MATKNRGGVMSQMATSADTEETALIMSFAVAGSLTLPYEASGTYSGTIDWGDGQTSDNTYANRTHTYASAGTYTVTVTGEISGFRFNNVGANLARELSYWSPNTFNLGNNGNYFDGCTGLTITTTEILNTVGTTNFSDAFENCRVLDFDVSVANWDMSNVTNLYQCFYQCHAFNTDLSNWDTGNVTNFSYTYADCISFNQRIDWDVSSGQDFRYIFWKSNNFNQSLLNWDVSSATSVGIGYMFHEHFGYNNVLDNWILPTNLTYMFRNAYGFNGDISNWDVSEVTIFNNMFQQAHIFNGDLGDWDIKTNNGTAGIYMNSMFTQCFAFEGIGLENWDVSNVISMTTMFYRCVRFNAPISVWDVSFCQLFDDMFSSVSKLGMDFDQDISQWDFAEERTGFVDFFANNQAGNAFSFYNELLIKLETYSDTVTVSGLAKIANTRLLTASTHVATGAGLTARTNLVNRGWVITDSTP